MKNLNSKLVVIMVMIYGIMTYIIPESIYYLGLSRYGIIEKKYIFQFVSYMFVHGSLMHLFSNSLALAIFGNHVERVIGSKKYLTFFLVCGVLSGLSSFLLYSALNINSLLIGASGAVYAIMLLFSVLYPSAEILVLGLIPLKSPHLILVYLILEFALQFRQDNIAHFAHLSGLVIAFIYIIVVFKINPFKQWKKS